MPEVDPERLNKLRQQRRLSKKELAGLLGITAEYLSRILNGKQQNVGDDTVAKIAEVFGVDKADFRVVRRPTSGAESGADTEHVLAPITEAQLRDALSRQLALFPRDFVGDVFESVGATSPRYREPNVLRRTPVGVFASTTRDEIATSNKCWTLLGIPGAGKSLWLVHVARHYLSQPAFVPLLVPLSSWTQQSGPSLGHWLASSGPFVEHMALTHPDTDAGSQACEALIMELRRERRLLLLLDGWDELSTAAQQRVRDRLATWTSPATMAACTIVVASRDGFPRVASGFAGNELKLEPITTPLRRRKFYELYIHDPARVDQLSSDIESHAELTVLKRNPFFLSLVAWLTGDPKHGFNRLLIASPFHLVQLYERAVETLLATGRAVADGTGPFERSAWPSLLSHFAWASLSEFGREPIPSIVATELLRTVIAEEASHNPDLQPEGDRGLARALKFLEDCRLFIAQYDTRQWLHSSLHEFLAGRYLASEHFDPALRRTLGIAVRQSRKPSIAKHRSALLADIAERRLWSENIVLAFDFALQLMDGASEDALLDLALAHWLIDKPHPFARRAEGQLRAAVLGIEGRAAHAKGALDRRLATKARWVSIPKGVPHWTSRGGPQFDQAGVFTLSEEVDAQRWHTTVGEYRRFVDQWAEMGGWRGLRRRLGRRLDSVLSHLSKDEQAELFTRTATISGSREYEPGKIDTWLEDLQGMDPEAYREQLRRKDKVWGEKWETMSQAERDAYDNDLYERSTLQLSAYQDWAVQQRASWNCPVVNITWWDAVAYCAWANLEVDKEYIVRLPYAHEWEAMVRLLGAKECTRDELLRAITPDIDFPGRSTLDPSRYSTRMSGLGRPSPVGAFEATPLADSCIWDLIGNAWCWTAGRFGLDTSLQAARACCGGSWNEQGSDLQVSHPGRYHADGWYMIIGFRPFKVKVR